MNKIVHDALILTAFTLVLGLILGVVYNITLPAITAANEATTKAAYQAVFEDAGEFADVDGFDSAAATEVVTAEGYSDTIDNVVEAKDASGATLGYVITVTAKDGSQGSITFSVGIQNDGTVNGYSITSISETPGLGMKAQEEEFYSQFEGKNVEKFEVTKTGEAGDNMINAITGSTITSKAMANGCNAALVYFRAELGGAQ